VNRADQFVFGYDDGHRLLSASRDVPRALMVRLLVATDAVMSPRCPPLLTGLALPDSGQFAFCVTWNDPQAKRAGAVCSHVLLIDAAALSEPLAVEALVRLVRNPTGQPLSGFSEPLSLAAEDGDSTPTFLSERVSSIELLERCIQVACRTEGAGVVLHPDLAEAARAIVSLWSAMWPALRARFSFRTRELAAADPSEFVLSAAPRLSGGSAVLERLPRPAPAWLEELACTARSPAPGALRSFLEEFGPDEPPEPLRLRRLAELWSAVTFEDVEAAAEQIEANWPDPETGAALKQALFGEHAQGWWSVEERDRVSTLLRTHPTWNVGALDLTSRVRALARGAHAG
jgi:hypothetical protein